MLGLCVHLWCGALSLPCPACCVPVSKHSGVALPVPLGVGWDRGHREGPMFPCSAARSPRSVCLTELLQCFGEAALFTHVYTSSHKTIHAHAGVLKASPPTPDHGGTRAGSQAPSYQPLCVPQRGLRSTRGQSLTSRSPWEELIVREWERGSLKERHVGLPTSAIAHQQKEGGNREQGKEKM